ncbi:tripartite tricarboxylate transporter substrate binding protein [Siccirubricoccus sp. KC 17139]|uniref:Tripartite tricarboxylate transporter substrate binding protein n=1 Tax=Siccirubricoccus soli TaxID=2899147 RepID=A0ABT1D6N2_9PROT|nr:tripartite tricarboxylate transporter substrate binding protein [Siccirubricoccus soli]MCO6417590.1 tripartite tricarboxylate transporter substrate binding protein [Siccirubricoccus soli]MCP2683725.1 tripartite tricarboxylate transporter substrate binding protein [Siccirubricoccus soli]
MPNAGPTRRALLLAPIAAPLAIPALAQPRYPDRPIRVFVPWTPGGATDVQMRSVCEIAQRHLGQPVVVENKPGASGTLGAIALKDAKPDGYTLSQMPNGVFRMPAMQAKPQWDPVADFTWIIRLVGYMGGVVVRPDAPWRTLPELVEYARANPGKLNYGTPGANTTEVQMQTLAKQARIEWVPVAFRGAAPNLQALLAGDIHFSAETSAWADMALEGRLRPLAVWMTERAKRFPDVPTFRECGYDVIGESTYGIAGPRGMEPEVVRIIHDAFRLAVHDPQHLAVLARFDMPVRYLGPEAFADDAVMLKEEARRIVQELGLRIG